MSSLESKSFDEPDDVVLPLLREHVVVLGEVHVARIGGNGLWSDLYAVVPRTLAAKPHVAEFVSIIRNECASSLDGIELL